MKGSGLLYLLIVFGILVAVFLSKKKEPNAKQLKEDSQDGEQEEEEGEWRDVDYDFPEHWRLILIQKVSFYNGLLDEEKNQFEFRVNDFLLNCRITGVKIAIDDTDRLLVASSAIIPVFRFPEWRYINLFEVFIYPSSFNEKLEFTGPDRRILGMVGTGYMEGKMILSRDALHLGFTNETDKTNTAVHEFVHLIDKMDGTIDGLPTVLVEKQYAIPWLALINKKIEEIYANRSDINPYGATSRIEFFAVISEYFFEQPKLLQKKHPELYEMLEKMFRHDMAERKLERARLRIGRNDPCPCRSGEKFKKCCGSPHFFKG
jgi:MtfA peptidase